MFLNRDVDDDKRVKIGSQGRRKSSIKSKYSVHLSSLKSRMNIRSLVIFTLISCVLHFSGFKGVSGYLWPKKNTYMTRWDKVNINEVLASKRLLHHYFNCLISKGPCPPDGMELKRVLPEALATACAKCSKSQIEGSIKVIRYLREFESTKFEILANKYDPKGIYRQKYFESSPENNTA